MLKQKGISWILLLILISLIALVLSLSFGSSSTFLDTSNKSSLNDKSKNVNPQDQIQSSTYSQTNQEDLFKLLNLALENFEKNKTFTIDLLTNTQVKQDGDILHTVQSKGVSVGDNVLIAEKVHVEYTSPEYSENDGGSTDTVIFYKNNKAYVKRPASLNKWIELNIKANSLNKLPSGTTSLLVKSIKPSSLKISDQNTLIGEVDSKVYFSNYDLYKKESNLYKDSTIYVEFWINRSTNQFSKIIYKVKNEPYLSNVDAFLDTDNTLTYTNFNEPVIIEKPTKDLITMEQLRNSDPSAAKIMEKETVSISASY